MTDERKVIGFVLPGQVMVPITTKNDYKEFGAGAEGCLAQVLQEPAMGRCPGHISKEPGSEGQVSPSRKTHPERDKHYWLGQGL